MTDGLPIPSQYWSESADALLAALQTSADGLGTADAQARLDPSGCRTEQMTQGAD
jgi:hypothetical protein